MKKRHSLEPIIPPHPRILILGSMPGEMSLKLKQYYAHKTNQFWKIVATLLNVKTPTDYHNKKKMLYEGRIALWDVIESCHRNGSSTSSAHAGVTFMKKLTLWKKAFGLRWITNLALLH